MIDTEPLPPEVPPDPELEAQGWRKRSVISPDRIDEVRELYEGLGLEVRLEPMPPSAFGPQCAGCAVTACESYAVIYTRPRG